MEPRIQYARTSDGEAIAYSIFGSGPAIIVPSSIWGSLHLYRHRAGNTAAEYDALTSCGWSLVIYDGRGMGGSDRGVEDHSLEARMRDIEAVIACAAPQNFALLGI